jgi:hypothetical protein
MTTQHPLPAKVGTGGGGGCDEDEEKRPILQEIDLFVTFQYLN